MKIGDYVRTDKGLIGKVIKKEEYATHTILEYEGQYCKRVLSTSGNDSEVIKSSPNIIDLIEVGDFIGKTIVEEVKEFDDGTRIIVMADGFDEYDENEYFLKAGIVTKEMYESMEYKINE